MELLRSLPLALALLFSLVGLAGGDQTCAEDQCGYECDKPCTCETGVPDCKYAPAFEDSDDPDFDFTGTDCAAYDDKHSRPKDMVWALVVASMSAPVMAFGIGANDIANSWATSVGSGAISVRRAVMLGAVFEFAGAVTLGFGVAKTIQKGVSKVTDEDCWACGMCDSKMGLLVGGTAGALAGASTFLMLATYLSLPVSTTHSIVGGVVGMTIVGAGPGCLNWKMKGGLGGIVASWFISPVLSGLVAAICYLISNKFVLGSARPRRSTMRLIPFLFGISTAFVIMMMMFKSKALKSRVSPDKPYTWKILGSLIAGVVVGLISQFTVIPWIRARLPSKIDGAANAIELGAAGKKKKASDESSSEEETAGGPKVIMPTPTGDADPTKPAQVEAEAEAGAVVAVNKEESDSDESYQMLDAQEAFKYVLVFIACLECFAHGSNDTANATGPFTAVYTIYRDGLYECSMPETPLWIMAVGGFFLSLGVVLYGQNVIQTIGSDITAVDFHKAFWIELAATFAVIFATVMEFPVSTTHCKIGAVVAVGMVAPKPKTVDVPEVTAGKTTDDGEESEEKKKDEGVNWGLLFKIVFTWVVTIPVAGSISAIFVAIVEKVMTG